MARVNQNIKEGIGNNGGPFRATVDPKMSERAEALKRLLARLQERKTV
jgi:hypothetical protein